MRVDVLPDRGERRDALDQQFGSFLRACGVLPVPAPNDPDAVPALVRALQPGAVVLSGGNDLAALGGNAPERDATEERLVAEAHMRQLPVIGVCRGMQFLVHRSGGSLARGEGHVATRHAVRGAVSRDVNSFHNWTIIGCGSGWQPLATAHDGSIEFAAAPAIRQWGVMWHPEREPTFFADDIALFSALLAGRTPALATHTP